MYRLETVRIALTITELDPGGAEQCLVQLAIFLACRGHEVRVFALGPTPSQTLGTTTNRQLLTDQLDHHRIPWKSGGAAGLRSLPKTIRWLRAELSAMSPDIVQSMLFHANFVTALANLNLRIPHFGGARVSQPNRLRRIAQRWAVGRMIRLICVSKAVARKCINQEGIAESKISIVPNGVDLKHSNEIESTSPPLIAQLIPKESRLLIFVGRLTQQKGILPLVERLDELLEKLPEHHLAILGDGPLKSLVSTAIAKANCRDRVHLLGWQPNSLEWIERADLLLLPSKYEGMPNVVMEAMSCRKPVVTFNVEGIEELLGDDAIQVVHEPRIANFIQRVQQISLDATLSKQLAERNRLHIEQSFCLEDQLGKYEQLYLRYFHESQGRSP